MNVWTAEVRVIARACVRGSRSQIIGLSSRAELESTNCATLGAAVLAQGRLPPLTVLTQHSLFIIINTILLDNSPNYES